MKNKIFTILFIVCLTVFAITFSIALPIYCKWFYYAQIKSLNLESTGYDYQTIKTAYSQMINYLTLPFTKFSTGSLKYSLEGASHFKDVKALFTLNAVALLLSLGGIVTLLILKSKNVIDFCLFKGKTPFFYAGIVNLALPVTIGALASINFEKAFDIFHLIFFPGKDNWIFNPKTDEIIKILPMQFFLNCAILIGVSLVILSTVYFVINAKKSKKQ